MDEVIDDQIDALCDEYEAHRSNGGSPDLEGFLKRVDKSSQPNLFYWLLRLERQFCSDSLESLSEIASNFVSDYPQHESVVYRVYPEARKKSLFPNIEGYQIKSFIDKGGQGSVYKAIQDRTGQRVAIKLVDVPASDRGSHAKKKAIDLLRNEVRALATLQHPNVVKIFDAGECEEGFFYVMQLVEGGSLADRIQSISQFDAADYVKQIASAVEAASRLGILHLDIKPGNILFDENSNQPLLTDFGLAQFIAGTEDARASGGTPAFMAPEQLKGGNVDTRTDIYGLGATLHALVHGDSKSSGGRKIAGNQTNARLRDICDKCLKPSPLDRYQSVGDLVTDLDRLAVREDARRVAKMGNRSILLSPFYLIVNGIVSFALYKHWEESAGMEIFIWLIVFAMYAGVFFTLSSAKTKNTKPGGNRCD